jgi:hypothetical protein
MHLAVPFALAVDLGDFSFSVRLPSFGCHRISELLPSYVFLVVVLVSCPQLVHPTDALGLVRGARGVA